MKGYINTIKLKDGALIEVDVPNDKECVASINYNEDQLIGEVLTLDYGEMKSLVSVLTTAMYRLEQAGIR